MNETYRISCYIRTSKLSDLLIPLYVRTDERDNFLYVSIQARDLSIQRFVVFEDVQHFDVVYKNDSEGSKNCDHSTKVGDPGILSFIEGGNYCSENIVTGTLKELRSSSEVTEMLAASKCYSRYSILKVYSNKIAKVYDLAKSLPRGSNKVWLNSEVSFLQKEKHYWGKIDNLRNVNSVNFSEGTVLSEFSSRTNALNWLMDNARIASMNERWVSIWEALRSHNADQETLYILANLFLSRKQWDQLFLRIYSKVYREIGANIFSDTKEAILSTFQDLESELEPQVVNEAAMIIQIWKLFMKGSYSWREPQWEADDEFYEKMYGEMNNLLYSTVNYGFIKQAEVWDDQKGGLVIGARLISVLSEYPTLITPLFLDILTTVLESDFDPGYKSEMSLLAVREYIVSNVDNDFRGLSKDILTTIIGKQNLFPNVNRII